MWRSNVFSRVGVSGMLQLSKALALKLHFGMHVHLQNGQVKFVCQGHWVKVKVTGTKQRVCVLCSRAACLRQMGNPVYIIITTIVINHVNVMTRVTLSQEHLTQSM